MKDVLRTEVRKINVGDVYALTEVVIDYREDALYYKKPFVLVAPDEATLDEKIDEFIKAKNSSVIDRFKLYS